MTRNKDDAVTLEQFLKVRSNANWMFGKFTFSVELFDSIATVIGPLLALR